MSISKFNSISHNNTFRTQVKVAAITQAVESIPKDQLVDRLRELGDKNLLLVRRAFRIVRNPELVDQNIDRFNVHRVMQILDILNGTHAPIETNEENLTAESKLLGRIAKVREGGLTAKFLEKITEHYEKQIEDQRIKLNVISPWGRTWEAFRALILDIKHVLTRNPRVALSEHFEHDIYRLLGNHPQKDTLLQLLREYDKLEIGKPEEITKRYELKDLLNELEAQSCRIKIGSELCNAELAFQEHFFGLDRAQLRKPNDESKYDQPQELTGLSEYPTVRFDRYVRADQLAKDNTPESSMIGDSYEEPTVVLKPEYSPEPSHVSFVYHRKPVVQEKTQPLKTQSPCAPVFRFLDMPTGSIAETPANEFSIFMRIFRGLSFGIPFAPLFSTLARMIGTYFLRSREVEQVSTIEMAKLSHATTESSIPSVSEHPLMMKSEEPSKVGSHQRKSTVYDQPQRFDISFNNFDKMHFDPQMLGHSEHVYFGDDDDNLFIDPPVDESYEPPMGSLEDFDPAYVGSKPVLIDDNIFHDVSLD